MNISIDPVISSRLQKAWAALSPDQRRRIAPLLVKAHQQAVQFSQTKVAPQADPTVKHQLLLAQSAITNDQEGVLGNLEAGVVVDVGPGGEIWGTGKYQNLDPGWTEAAAVWLENLVLGKHPFADSTPQTISVPNSVQIAMAGDWGTGDWRTAANPAPSTDVRKHMAFLQPHLTIHLGDVYYAGTNDQEKHLLVDLWPKGSLGALTLNSNHEMYSGAKPYFQVALAANLFADQQQRSFFALENDNWVIVGLDSAYYSNAEGLYLDGALYAEGGPQLQVDFLRSQAAKGKKVIVLTHHNGLTEDGSKPTALWSQVMSAFPEGGAPAYWYWGHVHAAVVYQPQTHGPTNVLCRCCGHGALPWGHALELANNPNVVWYENRLAKDPDIPQRVLNGFAVLYLDGPNINEVFYDENGGAAWP
ncbi:MAG TPA: metallophosphoesterase [Terriglobia bacterium]|nr:metallophosphoesterase [Terriglobia bacterium]